MKTIIAIIIITAALSISIVAQADDNIANYTNIYNNLCNVKLADNLTADMPHGKVSMKIENTNAILSSSGIAFVNNVQTIELKITREISSVNLSYTF